MQRQIVFDTLINLENHPTIDELYAEIHRRHPSISKTTIYRNLRQLAFDGLIRQVSLPDGLERYDGSTDPHQHFLCKKCDAIFDVDIPYLADIDETVRQKFGFVVDKHDMIFSGTCSKCSCVVPE